MLLKTNFDAMVREHKCKTCKTLVARSGYLHNPNMKEVELVGAWRKENAMIRTLTHPLDPTKIICIDLFCKCNKCGTNNQFIVSTTLDDKNKIKVQYNKLQQMAGKLVT